MEDFVSQIKYIPSFMNKTDSLLVYEYAQKNQDAFTDFGNTEQEFTVHTYHDIQNRESSTLDIIQYYAKKVYQFVLDNYGGEFEPFIDEKTHIAKFNVGKGMHDHYDSSRPKDIATLIYLNDDYEGGEIYFPKYGLSYKPKPGDLLCFPDNPNFVHGVRPITKGTRFTLPRWFTRII